MHWKKVNTKNRTLSTEKDIRKNVFFCVHFSERRMTNESNKKYGQRHAVQKRNTTGQGMMSQRKAKEKEEQYADNQSNVGRYQ